MVLLGGCAAAGDPVPASNSSGPGGVSSPIPSASKASGPSTISMDEAKVIAVQKVGGGEATEVEANNERDVAVWKVTVVNGTQRHRLSVDQQTGAVLVHVTES
jgi:uncharacterized membrane protein YkoI